MTTDGPIVDDVRRRRSEISTRFGDDLDRYAAHIRQLQDQHRERLVNQVTVVASSPSPAKVRP